MKKATFQRHVLPWLVVLGLFVIWEVGCLLFDVDEFILPRPTLVLATLLKYKGAVWEHSVQTLGTTMVGFAAGVVGGMILGQLVGFSRLLYNALYPLLVGFNSIPKVAVVPVLVIWFGIGTVPAILTAFLTSFFPIVVNVATGLATLEPELKDVLRSLGARQYEIFLKVGVPRSMPYFFASLKVAITLAFIGSVISETVAANKGIGYLMIIASSRLDTPLVFAGLVVIAFMGIALYEGFAVMERRFTSWAYRGQQG